ncbi:MAG: hypothetical protein IPJ66_00850 [Bacteroidetes bacterium]|nr:hypothetical protein [Bacteroidota bacterium]
MKSFCKILPFLLFSIQLFAQAPQKMSYQSVIRDSTNSLVINRAIGMKVSILRGSASGTPVFVETQHPTTNQNGLATFAIGTGTVVTGNFSTINWSDGPYFIKTQSDLQGGNNYTISGTTELLSVPYALYSENTNASNISGYSNLSSTKNGTMIVVYTNSDAYGFTLSSSGNPTWYSQGMSGTPLGAIATDSVIVVYTSNNAYGFCLSSSGDPTWYSQGLSGTPSGITASGNTIVVYTTTDTYGFTRSTSGNPTWYSQGMSGTPVGSTVNGKDCVVVYTSTDAYGFMTSASGSPTWYSQGLSGTTIGGSASGNMIVVYTSNSAYGFTRSSSGNHTWYSQGISGTPAGIVPK